MFTKGLNVCATRTDVVNAITLSKSGTEGKRIEYWASSGEVPILISARCKMIAGSKGLTLLPIGFPLKGWK